MDLTLRATARDEFNDKDEWIGVRATLELFGLGLAGGSESPVVWEGGMLHDTRWAAEDEAKSKAAESLQGWFADDSGGVYDQDGLWIDGQDLKDVLDVMTDVIEHSTVMADTRRAAVAWLQRYEAL